VQVLLTDLYQLISSKINVQETVNTSERILLELRTATRAKVIRVKESKEAPRVLGIREVTTVKIAKMAKDSPDVARHHLSPNLSLRANALIDQCSYNRLHNAHISLKYKMNSVLFRSLNIMLVI
jgi:hypothetical protein